MTLAEIRSSEKEFLVPTDVAPLMGIRAYSINCQANKDISKLGFPCSLIGTRVLIPRLGFLKWMEGSGKDV